MYYRCILIVILIVGEVIEGLELIIFGGNVVADRAAPYLSLGERLKVESSDYAKVIGAALEGKVKIRMRGCVCVDCIP